MKTKTSHSWKALQSNTNDFPEWVIIPIVIGGFLALYFLGAFVEWLLNLQILLK